MNENIKTIGVMTGNSLDAVDVVLTEFTPNSIQDLARNSLPYDNTLRENFLKLRTKIAENKSLMDYFENDEFFHQTLFNYTQLIAQAINLLCKENNINKSEIAAIGLHGQTCDHFPPSIAKGNKAYTLQLADAQSLADLTDIPVIYDFRSDDLMNGGEAAPLAPIHNLNISMDLKNKGIFPVSFCNAGNTGNIAIISENIEKQSTVKGFDIGPFNHFSDMLVRQYKNEPCDFNGKYGEQGEIIPELLDYLFQNVAKTNSDENFYLMPPPKSSDPSWYQLDIPTVVEKYGFENTLRTTEYLSAYTFFYSLSFVEPDVLMPCHFLLFGGGWKNPLVLNDFKSLLSKKAVILNEHKTLFEGISNRFQKNPTVQWSDEIGYSGESMEARIFADMAYCRIIGKPFSFPETTGCKSPTIAGIYTYPKTNKAYLLQSLFEKYQTKNIIPNDWKKKWNRASKGWQG